MSINKITNAPTPNEHIAKTNEVVDFCNNLVIPTVGNGTITITQGGSTKGSFTTNQSGNSTIDLDSGDSGSSRNIGEIVTSTIPLTDAGLHLLDGSLIYGNGIYADFVDYIANIYSASANYFCSESDWQTSVTNYGVCGKFVYDSTNNTVRLPKVTGFIEGTDSNSALGDLTEAGLPNIVGTFGDTVRSHTTTGAFYEVSSQSWKNFGTTNSFLSKVIGIDASLSSTVYGNSSTVQPQSVKVLYYIVVANSTKTEVQVDIDEIATDLNGKADVDGSNMVSSVKNFDGQWIWVRDDNKALSFTSVAEHTYDLSNILPNDDNTYLVRFQLRIRRTSSGTSGVQFRSPSTFGDNSGADPILVSTAPSSQNAYTISLIDVPIGSSRTLYVTVSENALSNGMINVLMIRRLGTNS